MPRRPSDGKDRAPPQTGVKGFLDNHPVSTLMGFAISTATVVVGAMTYYTSQRIEAVEARHKAEMLDRAATDKTVLLDATAPLKQTIADLTFRLSSIERRIGGTGPTYFDVSSISVGPETIKALDSKYKPFANGDFFVAVPEMGSWSYSETTEWDFISSMYQVKELNTTAANQVFSSKLHVWRSKSEIRFQIAGNSQIDHPTFTFYPAISLQKVTADFVKRRLRAIHDADSSDRKKPAKALAETIDQLNKQGRAEDDVSKTTNANEFAKTSSEKNTAQDVLQRVKRKDEILDSLGAAYSADDASFVLTDYLAGAMMQTMALGARHRIYSAQKKGNVLYLQDRITFQDAQAYVGTKLEEAKQNISVDVEVFYFGNGAEGYIVKVILPSVPDRADAFSWTKSWLTGLQIPLG